MPELSIDEGVRAGTTPEALAGLRAAFQEDGLVTAGNASTLNDGTSAVLVADEEFAKQNGWEIIAIVEDYCTAGVEPSRVMYAPVPAIQMLLERAGMDVMDIDVYEHNEAFASFMCSHKRSEYPMIDSTCMAVQSLLAILWVAVEPAVLSR